MDFSSWCSCGLSGMVSIQMIFENKMFNAPNILYLNAIIGKSVVLIII